MVLDLQLLKGFELRDLIVIKRNGKKNIFDREKIVKSMEIALRKRLVDNEIIERAPKRNSKTA